MTSMFGPTTNGFARVGRLFLRVRVTFGARCSRPALASVAFRRFWDVWTHLRGSSSCPEHAAECSDQRGVSRL